MSDELPAELAERWYALAADVRRRLGTGARLESRPRFEQLLGADLERVLAHRTPFAGRVAAAARADAIAVGGRVLGSPEQLNAGTRRGAALIAHEATHAVQQTSQTAVQPAVQRAEAEEASAQSIESIVLDTPSSPTSPTKPIDPEVIAERVYRRLMDDLRRERERMAWPA